MRQLMIAGIAAMIFSAPSLSEAAARGLNAAPRVEGHGYEDPRSASRRAFYADDHYRDGRLYPQRRLGHPDRIYRGRDGRYYCRRRDGTTGLIVGGGVEALLGDAVEPGHSRIIGTLNGVGVGGVLSLWIDSGAVRCR